MLDREYFPDLERYGLNHEHKMPGKGIPILHLYLEKIESRRSIIPAVITHLKDHQDPRTAQRVIDCLKHPRKHAFRTFYRTEEDPWIPNFLDLHGIEFPLEKCENGKLFIELGDYTMAQDYLLPKKQPEAIRAFDPIKIEEPVASWLTIYKRKGIVYIDEAAAIKIIDEESLRDKLIAAVKINWKNATTRSSFPQILY